MSEKDTEFMSIETLLGLLSFHTLCLTISASDMDVIRVYVEGEKTHMNYVSICLIYREGLKKDILGG